MRWGAEAGLFLMAMLDCSPSAAPTANGFEALMNGAARSHVRPYGEYLACSLAQRTLRIPCSPARMRSIPGKEEEAR